MNDATKRLTRAMDPFGSGAGYSSAGSTIRDPVHGTIEVDARFRAVIASAPVQRLRGIRQLGFADVAYPGATHSRFSHSLGAMFVSGRMMSSVLATLGLAPEDAQRLSDCAQLSALLHDLGHPPLSHAGERLMPRVSTLGLSRELVGHDDRQATHEDYTLLFLLSPELAEVLDAKFGRDTARIVAALVSGHAAALPPGALTFSGCDFFPLLRQLVSSEIDVDRMDYLLRDSLYTGVNYGKYDLDWMCQNARAHVRDGRAYLAITNRAVFAFEDFLLSRLHMFLAVYHHYVPVCFDYFMDRYCADVAHEFRFPSDAAAYVQEDDASFIVRLRASASVWGQRLARGQTFRLLAEATERDRAIDSGALTQRLASAGIEGFLSKSTGVLSKYVLAGAEQPIYVVNETTGDATVLEQYTPLYRRYADNVQVSRVYCEPSKLDEARALCRDVLVGAVATAS